MSSQKLRATFHPLTILVFIALVVILFFSVVVFGVLTTNAYEFFTLIDAKEFFTENEWSPFFESSQRKFGFLPIIFNTILIASLACMIAMPFGVLIALYLSEYSHRYIRRLVKASFEIISSLPTVMFGFFAMTALTPFLKREIFGEKIAYSNALSAILMIAFLVTPLIVVISLDAFRSAGEKNREFSFALGATKFQTIQYIIFPQGINGVLMAFAMAFSRAIGETMIVLIASGVSTAFHTNILKEMQNISSFIASSASSDTLVDKAPYLSLFACALILFLLVSIVNAIIFRLKKYFIHSQSE